MFYCIYKSINKKEYMPNLSTCLITEIENIHIYL
nr:MAG TPA: hypothetical protein [Caudoviricetes sp.]